MGAWVRVVSVLLLASTAAACSGGPPQPSVIAPTGYTYDIAYPEVLDVVFPWQHDGWCAGQFDVQVAQTSGAVVVKDVRNGRVDIYRGDCAGLGSDGEVASVQVPLAGGLLQRRVVDERGDPLTRSPSHDR